MWKITTREWVATRNIIRPAAYFYTVVSIIIGFLYQIGFVSLPATASDVKSVKAQVEEIDKRLNDIGQISTTVESNKKSLAENKQVVQRIEKSVQQLQIDQAVNKSERRGIKLQLNDIKTNITRILNKLN